MKKATLITLISVFIILCGFGLRGKISGVKFDSEKWKKADYSLEENWSLRWDMMNSLRNNYELNSMSKTEILNLLGKPYESVETDTFSYSLGMSHTGINTGTLTIEFKNDRVERLVVHQG